MTTSFPFLQLGNVKKYKKIRKIPEIEEETCTSLNHVRSFTEVFRKDLAYDNIKSHKKAEFVSLFRKYIFF